MSKAKHWIFTLNNYTEEEESKVRDGLPPHCKFISYGREVGENGTPHLQGFISWTNRRSLRQCRALFPRAHWEIKARSSSFEEAIEYTEKDGDFIQHGTKPNPPGKRTDLERVRERIRAGDTDLQLADSGFGQWVFHRKSYAAYRALLSPPILRPGLKVFVLQGMTGVGKTRFCHEYGMSTYGRVYLAPDPTLQWFDGYSNHECVVIDDFDGKHVNYRNMLRYTDIYPLSVPVKGDFVPFNPEIIFITTNVCIETWFDGIDVSPLRRRVSWYLINGGEYNFEAMKLRFGL